jgi:hypothetical protein
MTLITDHCLFRHSSLSVLLSHHGDHISASVSLIISLLALCELTEIFGQPLIHSGLAIRKLGNKLFECRGSLALHTIITLQVQVFKEKAVEAYTSCCYDGQKGWAGLSIRWKPVSIGVKQQDFLCRVKRRGLRLGMGGNAELPD